jgi:peroxiredoxin
MSMVSGLIDALETVRPGLGTAAAEPLTRAAHDLLEDNKAMLSRQEGEIVDDFALPDASGRTLTLSNLLVQGPAVLTFYRGGWCGYCSAYLRALNDHASELRDEGAEVIAISPQTMKSSAATVEKLGLTFPVLSDLDNVVARSFGLVYVLPEAFRDAYARLGIDLPATNGTTSFELPVPATYVIGTDRRIAYADVDADYTRRPDPPDLLRQVRSMHRPAVRAG